MAYQNSMLRHLIVSFHEFSHTYAKEKFKLFFFSKAHRQSYVEQTRGNDRALGGYKLILKDVGEYGWTQSYVTKLR